MSFSSGGKNNFQNLLFTTVQHLENILAKKPGVAQFQDSIRGSVSLAGRIENATSMLEEIRTALVKLLNAATRKKGVHMNFPVPHLKHH